MSIRRAACHSTARSSRPARNPHASDALRLHQHHRRHLRTAATGVQRRVRGARPRLALGPRRVPRAAASSGGSDRVAEYARSKGENVDADAVHRTKSELFQRASAEAGLTLRPGVDGDASRRPRTTGYKVAFVTTTAPRERDRAAAAGLRRARRDDFDLIVDPHRRRGAQARRRGLRLRAADAGRDAADVRRHRGQRRRRASRRARPASRCIAFPNENTAEHDFARGRPPCRSASSSPTSSSAGRGARRARWATSRPRPARPPSTAFHVEGYEKIEFSLLYVDGAFAVGERRARRQLRAVRALPDGRRRDRPRRSTASRCRRTSSTTSIDADRVPRGDLARRRSRCARSSGSSTRSRRSGSLRKEPVLVVGGGLTTDVAGPRVRDLPPRHELHPRPDDADRPRRRERRDQGRRQPGPPEEPARRLPRVREGDPGLLVPGDAARGAGAQRDGRAGQDRRRRQRRRLRRCSRSTARSCCARASATSTGPPSCGTIGHRLTYDAIGTMLDLEVPEPARARPRPRDRLRPHVEPDARARARVPDAARARRQRRHGALGHARRRARLHLRRRPRSHPRAHEPPRASRSTART